LHQVLLPLHAVTREAVKWASNLAQYAGGYESNCARPTRFCRRRKLRC
jgi:hypothetical protein